MYCTHTNHVRYPYIRRQPELWWGSVDFVVTLLVGVFGVSDISDVSVFDSTHTCVSEYIEIFGHFYGCSVWAMPRVCKGFVKHKNETKM